MGYSMVYHSNALHNLYIPQSRIDNVIQEFDIKQLEKGQVFTIER